MRKLIVLLIILYIFPQQKLISDWYFKEKLIGNKINGFVSYDSLNFGFLTLNMEFYSIPKFYLTNDGGKTWEQTLKNKDNFLDTIDFSFQFKASTIVKSNDDVIYMLDENKVVLKSTDKGKNWNRFKFTFTDSSYIGTTNIFKLKMYDSEFGFLVTDFKIYKTIDSCKSFTEFNIPSTKKINFYDIEAINDSTYLLFIYDPMSNLQRYMKTTNFGESWGEITDFTYNRYLNYIDQRFYLWKAVAISQSSNNYSDNILCSKDSGQTWELKYTYEIGKSSFSNIRFFNFLNADLGIAFGYTGRIFFTDDGGDSWYENAIPTSFNISNFDIDAAFRVSKEKAVAISSNTKIFIYDTNIGIIESQFNEDIRVFPNPCTDKLIVDYGFDKPNEIILYDLLGNIVSSTTDNFINTSNLLIGTYFLTLEYSKGNKSFIIHKIDK